MIEIIEKFPIGNKLNEDEYYEKIASAWYKTTEGILETATSLLTAKTDLSKIEWIGLRRRLEDNNIISTTVISKLLGIAKNKVFSNPSYQKFLPPSYATLYLMKDQDEQLLIEKIKSNDINPTLEQKDIHSIFKERSSEDSNNTKSKPSKITITGDLTLVNIDDKKTLKDIFKKLRELGIKVKYENMSKKEVQN